MSTPEWFELRIDAHGSIVDVNESWSEFAEANGAVNLANRVVGTSLWGQISGRAVQDLYRGMTGRVRRTGRAMEFPFRCDSPECKRILVMRVEPEADKVIVFRSRIVRETPRERVSLFDREGPTEEPALQMCAICCRILKGSWIEVEDAARTLGLFMRERQPTLSYTVCLACRKTIKDPPEDDRDYSVEELFGPDPTGRS